MGGGTACPPALHRLREEPLAATVCAELMGVERGGLEHPGELLVAAPCGAGGGLSHRGCTDTPERGGPPPERVSFRMCVSRAKAVTDSLCGARMGATRLSFSSCE